MVGWFGPLSDNKTIALKYVIYTDLQVILTINGLNLISHSSNHLTL